MINEKITFQIERIIIAYEQKVAIFRIFPAYKKYRLLTLASKDISMIEALTKKKIDISR